MKSVHRSFVFLTAFITLVTTGVLSDPLTNQDRMTLIPLESEPANGRKKPSDAELKKAGEAVKAQPKDRSRRFEFIRLLMSAEKMDEALEAAKEWRKADAYHLVVVRLIGDILSEMGRVDEARRVYSAVVELLPKDAGAHRALATVLKQAGDMDSAYARLTSASKARPEDLRLAFELADAAARLGRQDEAARRFGEIAEKPDAPNSISYPSKQRLAQILSSQKREKLQADDKEGAAQIADKIDALKIKGGVVNDIKVYLTWDTDGSDVDLWVINPAGQKVFYSNKKGRYGGELFHDVTNGYGPESFTAHKAQKGNYLVQVHYYGTNRAAFSEARGEVVVVLAEGTADETRHVLPYRLFKTGQKVSVAKIRIK